MYVRTIERIAAALSGLLLVGPALAGADTFRTWADKEDLGKKIVVYDHLTPAVAKLAPAGIARPKRVGLVSFYLWDTGSYEFNAMAYQYGGTYEQTSALTPKGANHFATKLAQAGVPALKKAFAAHGFELLTPAEFTTSDELRQSYVSFQLPMGGLARATVSTAEWISKSPTASSAAAGFSGIHAHLFTDAKGLSGLEELRRKLGLDALVVVANTSSSYDKGVILGGIQLLVYGPNPTPLPPQKLAQIGWSPGALFARGDFAKGFKGVEFAKIKKGSIESESYDGYDEIMETLADETLRGFDEQYGQ
jgi:hypothetical protein